MRSRQTPEEIAKIQKIQRQPGDCVKTPLRTGPIAMAKLGLQVDREHESHSRSNKQAFEESSADKLKK